MKQENVELKSEFARLEISSTASSNDPLSSGTNIFTDIWQLLVHTPIN